MYYDKKFMKVIRSITKLKNRIRKLDMAPLGLVPTMGALHEGHLSLVRNALEVCPLVVVSIFINPAQFNDKNDLRNYPRTPEADLTLLGEILRKDDIVFAPDDKEIYPVEDKRIFNLGNLSDVLEGFHRPGHFNGVAQVVSRLFEIVNPDMAFFGIKDLQQVAVIRELVRQCHFDIRIITNPIVRESDGLALSSRNRLLEPITRRNASLIFKTLKEASLMIKSKDIPEIKDYVISTLGQVDDFRVEYFEVVDDKDFIPVNRRVEMKEDKIYFGCIAVIAGKIRLIDNIEFSLL